jgi:uncharacterized protein YdgA (DUF945 family)
MKKYLLPATIIVAVTISIVIGAPFATGMMAEKQYHSMIRENPFKPALQLESRNFERGFFSSYATTFIEITDPVVREALADELGKDENGKVGLFVHHQLSHGPLIFTAGQGVDFAIARATHLIRYSDSVNSSSGKKRVDMDLFRADTSLHFDGSQTVDMGSRDILNRSDGTTTTLMPASITFVTDKNYRTFKGGGNWGGMVSENSRGGKVSISDARFKFDLEKSGEMWLGSISLAQDSITMDSPEKSLQMDGLKVESGSSGHGVDRLIDFTAQLSLQQAKTADRSFGPGELSLAVNNVPATALERLNAIQQRVRNSSLASRDFALQAAGIEAAGLLPELLSHGIVIDMERLYFNTPDGEIIGHFHFSLPKTDPSSLMNIPYLKSIIDLDAGLSLPLALIPEATMKKQIQPLLDRGYLKIDGESLKSGLRMSAGVVTINGRVVSLPY